MSKVHTLRTDVATVDDFFSFFFKAKHWESDAPSLCAALGLSWSGPLETKWQSQLRILSGIWIELFLFVFNAKVSEAMARGGWD